MLLDLMFLAAVPLASLCHKPVGLYSIRSKIMAEEMSKERSRLSNFILLCNGVSIQQNERLHPLLDYT
jgi:hypothetical protein